MRGRYKISGISLEEDSKVFLWLLLLMISVKQIQIRAISEIPTLFSFSALMGGHDLPDISVCLAVDISSHYAGTRVTSCFPFFPPHSCSSIYRWVPQRKADEYNLYCTQSPLEINKQRAERDKSSFISQRDWLTLFKGESFEDGGSGRGTSLHKFEKTDILLSEKILAISEFFTVLNHRVWELRGYWRQWNFIIKLIGFFRMVLNLPVHHPSNLDFFQKDFSLNL